jgi:hypothetical protein
VAHGFFGDFCAIPWTKVGSFLSIHPFGQLIPIVLIVWGRSPASLLVGSFWMASGRDDTINTCVYTRRHSIYLRSEMFGASSAPWGPFVAPGGPWVSLGLQNMLHWSQQSHKNQIKESFRPSREPTDAPKSKEAQPKRYGLRKIFFKLKTTICHAGQDELKPKSSNV